MYQPPVNLSDEEFIQHARHLAALAADGHSIHLTSIVEELCDRLVTLMDCGPPCGPPGRQVVDF